MFKLLLIALFFTVPAQPCSSTNPRACVQQVYDTLTTERGAMDNSDILAITFYGELGLFTTQQGLKALAIEALVRSYYDTQSGACRPACDHIVDYLTNSQHWRDSIRNDVVNMTRLLGKDDAYLKYKDMLQNAIDLHPEWLTGQGYGLPSMWGNIRLDAGDTTYPTGDGVLGALVVHYYSDRSATFGDDVPAIPDCTLAAVIIDVTGRFKVGTCS